jgi:osmotically-inducible protein OsmY
MRRQLPFFVAAAFGGAALAYYLDPVSGRRRRHTTRDRTFSLVSHGRQRSRRLARHASSEAYGLGQRLVHNLPGRAPDLDDVTLAHKVESILFRDRDVPKGNINVNAENGVVFLRGEVERPELVEALGERVHKVRGVRGVENLLHVPAPAPEPKKEPKATPPKRSRSQKKT